MSDICIVLAAGDGKRMKSVHPKVLAEVLFTPMLGWVLDAVSEAGIIDTGVIIGNGSEEVTEYLNSRTGEYRTFMQAERKGTGHAVMMAEEMLKEDDGNVLVLCGDAPFIDAKTIEKSREYHVNNGNDVTVITAETEPQGYGRIIRSGERLLAIVEEKDCTPEQRSIREVNSGAYWFNRRALLSALPKLSQNNAAGEYYLTDTVALLSEKAGAYRAMNRMIIMGANSRAALYDLNELARGMVMRRLMDNGVEFVGISYVAKDANIGADTGILPGTIIKSGVRIGSNCKIGPSCQLENCAIGDNVTLDNVVATDSHIENNVKAGPFVQLRPGTTLKSGVKIGDFVEIKNSIIGEKTSVAHLTYLGDSDVGKGCNFGCGCVTANYDGVNKYRTVIGDNCFIGCNTNLVAPVKVGDNATTGAGSTITRDVPANSLVVERAETMCREDWEKNKLRKKKI